jgi:hypothetical protein
MAFHSNSDSDGNVSNYDTDTDTDADAEADAFSDDVYNVVVDIITGKAVGRAFQTLIDDFHDRHAAFCACRGMLPTEAETHHVKLLLGALEWYYGEDYAVVFNPPLGLEAPTSTQISSMFPDERVPYLVQFRLIKHGFMDRLPRLVVTPESTKDLD